MNGYPAFSATDVDAAGEGATATAAAVPGQSYVVTSISGYIDEDATVTIQSPAGTALFTALLDLSVEGFSFHFGGLNIPCPLSQAAVGDIDTTSAKGAVTISGYTK